MTTTDRKGTLESWRSAAPAAETLGFTEAAQRELVIELAAARFPGIPATSLSPRTLARLRNAARRILEDR